MTKIGLLSDTHGYLDDTILKHLRNCDEIWHAGDYGTVEVVDTLKSLTTLRGVYGNIDGKDVRLSEPLHQKFEIEGLKVWITHIGGYPGRYAPNVKAEIYAYKPDIFISGHSHILKVMKDPKASSILHLNPGAAGRHGFHKVRTMLLFELNNGKIEKLQAVELGPRAK